MIPIDLVTGALVAIPNFSKSAPLHLPTRRNIQSNSSTIRNMFKTAFRDRDDAAADVLRPLLRRSERDVPGSGLCRWLNFVSYFYSRQNRAGRVSAQPLRAEEARLRCCRTPYAESTVPMPKILCDPDRVAQRLRLDAIRHASVAVTHDSGFAERRRARRACWRMNSAVNNHDILISSVAATIVSAITMLASIRTLGHALLRLRRSRPQ
jgi:hypothetical protein